MTMQVRHGFAGVGTIVEHEPKTVLPQAQLFGHFGGLQQEMAEDLMIFRRGFGDARDRFLRNDQHVLGRLRFDVAKRDHLVVFIKDRGRDFAGDDLFK